MDEHPTVGPLSWRDVYAAVETSEKRILARLDSHEGRVTKLLEQHEARLNVIDGRHLRYDAGAEARGRLAATSRTAVVTIAALVSGAVAILNRVLP